MLNLLGQVTIFVSRVRVLEIRCAGKPGKEVLIQPLHDRLTGVLLSRLHHSLAKFYVPPRPLRHLAHQFQNRSSIRNGYDHLEVGWMPPICTLLDVSSRGRDGSPVCCFISQSCGLHCLLQSMFLLSLLAGRALQQACTQPSMK